MSDIEFANMILKLIEKQETEFVDFKREHHRCDVDLIHDILCLANAEGEQDRYIIYGVDDNNRNIVGIDQKSTDRKRENNYIDILRNKCNRLPTVYFKSIQLNEKVVDVLIIKNKPYKPYFLLKDVKRKTKEEGGKKSDKTEARAGVVYSRVASVNTPINETASEVDIKNMWEERFGLILSPLERMNSYIEDTQGWRKTATGAYYAKFPEFTLEYENDLEPSLKFFEHWHEQSGLRSHELGTKKVFLKYHSTCLQENITLINVEFKLLFPVPKYKFPNDIAANSTAIISKSLPISKIAAILDMGDYNHEGVDFATYWKYLRDFFHMHSREFKLELVE